MLVSSHALMSRVTPESGRGGGTGRESEALCVCDWILMRIGGIGGTALGASALPVEGAVPGRFIVGRSLKPPSRSLAGWNDGSLRRRRCSHCFAVSCLLRCSENALVVGAVIVTVF
jgi:hypothetical protein